MPILRVSSRVPISSSSPSGRTLADLKGGGPFGLAHCLGIQAVGGLYPHYQWVIPKEKFPDPLLDWVFIIDDDGAFVMDGSDDIFCVDNRPGDYEPPPGWLPEGAIAYADFVNGRYYANGAETTLGGMFEENLSWGTWDGTDSITGDNLPVLKAAVTNALTTGATVVIDVLVDSTATVVEFVDLADYDPDLTFTVSTTNAAVSDYNANEGSVAHGVTAGNLVRSAFTMTPTKISVSANGSSVDDAVPTTSWTSGTALRIALGGYGAGVIQSIAIHAPVADAALPALSAL